MAIYKIDVGEFEAVTPFTGAALPELKFIPINQLIIDDRYQRSIERRGKQNILKIAQNFDWSKFSPVVLSRRAEGTYAVIDGQHRTHAAALCGIQEVPAIITSMTIEQEASAFSWVNGSVTALTPNSHDQTLCPVPTAGGVYEEGGPRHEYDHHLGYASEHHESVEAVCSSCHAEREKKRGTYDGVRESNKSRSNREHNGFPKQLGGEG